MHPAAHRHQQKGFIDYQNFSYMESVKNPNKETNMLNQIRKFPIGTTTKFCDRHFVIDVTIIDNTIPGQISVIDKQGFIHIGNIEEHKEYLLMTIASTANKYRNGYNPDKSNAIPLSHS